MRIGHVAWAGAGILALLVSACDDDGGNAGTGGRGTTTGNGGNGGTGEAGGTTTTGAQPTCDDDAGTIDLGGVWAGRASMTVGLEGTPGGLVSVCPEEQEGKAELLFVLTAHQSGTALEDVTVTVCDASLPAVTAVAGTCSPGTTSTITTEVLLPDALRDALPKLLVSPVKGELAEATAGAEVTFERFVLTAGASATAEDLPAWDVEDPACKAANLGNTSACEALCVEGCASLRDDDGDAYPGVTLDVCGRTADDKDKKCPAEGTEAGVTIQGRAFAAVRVDPEITAKALSSCSIKGTVDATVAYSVVGADVSLAGLAIPVASAVQALPKMVVKPDKSPVTLVRADGRFGSKGLDLDPNDPAAACAALREKQNEVF